jgi:hypothetical protein
MKLRALGAAIVSALTLVAASAIAGITGRTPPPPIVGITYDDVSNTGPELTTLESISRMPAVRIVFDTGEPASYYKGPISTFYPAAYIMGELIDSSYMISYTPASARSWTQSYVSVLGSAVDIWEVGNEVNANWLSNESNGADVMPKIEAMYSIVTAQGGRTALTFFYEGEPSDPNNCIATDHGGNDMFTWITTNFSLNLPVSQRSAATEAIRTGVNYVLISWYPADCPGEKPNWPAVYTKVASIFPQSQVGFGELGTDNPQDGSTYEDDEIASIYPLYVGETVPAAEGSGTLPPNYIGGVFWWYAAEEMVPWPGYLGCQLQQAIAQLPGGVAAICTAPTPPSGGHHRHH